MRRARYHLCACLLSVPKRVRSDLSKVNKKTEREEKNSTVLSKEATRVPRRKLETPFAYSSFRSSDTISEFRERYNYLAPGEKDKKTCVRVAGRLSSIRDMGKILFLTIRSNGLELQIVGQVGEYFSRDYLKNLKNSIRVGDIVGIEGFPCRMKRGELSVNASNILVLSPYVCTDQIVCPDLRGFTSLQDNDIKYRYRFVDMMTNRKVIDVINKRHKILKALRDYLNEQNFIEVETPILHTVASGANARPFITHHNANETDLFLRVAPELYLKQCIVGGMERVYEIGRVFRNEDADRSHNPEFTSCELYAAYRTYEDLIPMTENIFRHLAMCTNGTTVVQLCTEDNKNFIEVDLSKPFRRVSVYDEIQKAAGVEFPPPYELNSPKGLAYMSAVMLRHNIPLPSVRTAAKMFDKLIDFFITDRIVEPIFVMDHPLFMSPLAKEHSLKPGLSERFELFINGVEYCNAYSELNDPQEQYYRFQQQLVDRQSGDDEAMPLDETFLKSLQVGLPPTAGWGMGIDRVVMLMTNSCTIRDGIIFPLLRQDISSHDFKRRCKTATFFDFNQQMTLFCLNGVEQEMKRCGFPEESCTKIRELRKTIIDLGQHGRINDHSMNKYRWSEWRLGLTLAIIRLVCGRPKL